MTEVTRLAPDGVWAFIDLGDLYRITGPLEEAAKAFRNAGEAARRQEDERDLSVSFNRLGDVQMAQGDLAGALKSYQVDLAIADRLAKSDSGNASWQHDLSVSYDRIGDVQLAQGDLAGALVFRRPINQRAPHEIRPRQCALAARSVGVKRETW